MKKINLEIITNSMNKHNEKTDEKLFIENFRNCCFSGYFIINCGCAFIKIPHYNLSSDSICNILKSQLTSDIDYEVSTNGKFCTIMLMAGVD